MSEHPAYEVTRPVTTLARVLLQDNPGPMTLDGSRELVAQVPVLGATQENLGRNLGTVMVGEACVVASAI